MRRLLRAVDVRFVMALAVLLVATTICWGFVQRGDHIGESERAVTSLSTQLSEVSEDNRRLRKRVLGIAQRAAREDRLAHQEQVLLLRELARLNHWLREYGVVVPNAVRVAPRRAQSVGGGHPVEPSTSQPNHQQPAHNGSANAPSNGGGGGGSPDLPGNAPAHSHASNSQSRAHGHGVKP